MWQTVYGKSFWKLGQLKVYRYDLDSDGLEDVIVKVEFGFCSRGSTVCSHFFLFGDQPPPVANSFSGYSIMADSAPVLTLRGGVDSLSGGSGDDVFTSGSDFLLLRSTALADMTASDFIL